MTELRQGQLVKDDFFTLFEAVGALEVSLHYSASMPLLKFSIDHGP
jgi:hypothetical protein